MEKAKGSLGKYFNVLHRNQVFVVLLLVSAVLIMSLLRSRSYLNPERNEDRYNEGVLQIKYSTIDQKILTEIAGTLDDKNIEVDSSLEPGRNNPFAE